MPAHVAAGFNLLQAIVYLASSRRLMQSVKHGPAGIRTIGPSLAHVGDSLLALLALDQGLGAVRWLLANNDGARESFPAPGIEAMEQFWLRVRSLRNELVHVGSRPFQARATMKIVTDGIGLHVGPDTVAFRQWEEWLDALEPWLWAVRSSGIHPGTAVARPPQLVQPQFLPEAQGDLYPPPGEIWFGRSHNPANPYVTEGVTRRFPIGGEIAFSARFVRRSPVQIELTLAAPDGTILVVQSASIDPGQTLAASTLRLNAGPGEYTMTIRDEMGGVLASGRLELNAST